MESDPPVNTWAVLNPAKALLVPGNTQSTQESALANIKAISAIVHRWLCTRAISGNSRN